MNLSKHSIHLKDGEYNESSEDRVELDPDKVIVKKGEYKRSFERQKPTKIPEEYKRMPFIEFKEQLLSVIVLMPEYCRLMPLLLSELVLLVKLLLLEFVK